MGAYEGLVSFIIENVGGRENIKSVTHCLTRLRFVLVDDAKANPEKLNASKEIVTTQFAGGKYQVVIGTHVGDVFDELERALGGDTGSDDSDTEIKTSPLNRFISIITQTMTPILGVLGACGLIAAVKALLVTFGVIAEGDGVTLILNALGQACFTFLPVSLGYSSAKAFGMNPFTGMMLGGVLIFPGLAESMSSGDALFTVFSGTPMEIPVYKTFLGIPIMFPALGYSSTVIPIILTTWCCSKLEHICNSVLPKNARMNLTPMFILLVGGTLSLLIVGPVSVMLTNLLSWAINIMFEYARIPAIAIIAFVYQPLVVLGLHWSLISIGITEMASTGSSLLLAIIVPATFAYLAVCLAVALRTKVAAVRETSLAAAAPTIFCIIEPAIYGVCLPVKKRFGICMLAGTIGALIIGATNSPKYSSGMGVTDIPTFINPNNGDMTGMIWCLVAVAATIVAAFILAYVTYKPSDDGEVKNAPAVPSAPRHGKVSIPSPMSGKVKALADMDDPAFAGGGMGEGVCIVPAKGEVVAPFDGEVTVMFPTGHAVGVKASDGTELMIHIGIDTVSLPEGTFTKHVKQGDRVRQGDVLVTFDPQAITKAGCSTDTAVIVPASTESMDVIVRVKDEAVIGEDLLTVVCGDVASAPAVTNAALA